MRELTRQEEYLLFSHMPRFARTFYMRPPTHPAELADMNMTHLRTLVLLRMNGATPMSVAARWLNLEKGSFTPVARRLLSAGLVEFVTDEADHRRTLLRLTPEGKALDERMHARLTEKFARKIDLLAPAEQRTLFTCLHKMKDLFDKMDPDDGSDFPHPAMPCAQEGTPSCSD